MKYRGATTVLPFLSAFRLLSSLRFLAILVLLPGMALAGDAKSSPPPRMSKATRMEIIRAFNAELIYIRTPFPMGKTGLRLKDGSVSPSGAELQQLMAMWGPAAKPGEQARISDVIMKDNHIRFEINGGPIKKQKWYQRISISGASGQDTPIAPSDSSANPRGSFVDLYFDRYIPELTGPQLKEMLHPVFDFNAKSAVEAYLDTVPPKVKEAIQKHEVLVGMIREMVTYSLGRPPKKIREKDSGGTEYEDWIYGTPPQDVQFVRMVGDEVARVEIMKMGGEKIVRTEKEVDLHTEPTVAATKEEPQERPVNAPTLRRPGEDLPPGDSPTSMPAGGRAPMPMPVPSGSPDPNGTQVPNLVAVGRE